MMSTYLPETGHSLKTLQSDDVMIDLAIDGKVFIENKIDAALQELDLIFNTERTELINDPYFGSNFEQFLWILNPSFQQIETYIHELISGTYFLKNMQYDIDVEMLEGDYRYIYYVKIAVMDDTGKVGMREYEFR